MDAGAKTNKTCTTSFCRNWTGDFNVCIHVYQLPYILAPANDFTLMRRWQPLEVLSTNSIQIKPNRNGSSEWDQTEMQVNGRPFHLPVYICVLSERRLFFPLVFALAIIKTNLSHFNAVLVQWTVAKSVLKTAKNQMDWRARARVCVSQKQMESNSTALAASSAIFIRQTIFPFIWLQFYYFYLHSFARWTSERVRGAKSHHNLFQSKCA